MKRSAIALAVLGVLASRLAHGQPTLVTAAWKISVPNAFETGPFPTSGLDHSGNFYFVYQQPHIAWLRAYSPAEDQVFNVPIDTFVNQPDSLALYIHTTHDGIGEYEDVVAGFNNSGNEATALYRYDVQGN